MIREILKMGDPRLLRIAPLVPTAMLGSALDALGGKSGKSSKGGSPLDLDDYVTAKTLDGLFATIAEQEQSIRQNPAARTTDLLKKVFGGR